MIAAILLFIIDLMILMKTGEMKKVGVDAPGKKDWTVYGTMGCGWTRKQLEHMETKGVSHTFVDCDEGECPGMDAFPTLVHKDGEKIVGFKEV